jgi:3-hydroxyisobutyrate dehydrogenase-like beta-hydroxyacid dehydrogenase
VNRADKPAEGSPIGVVGVGAMGQALCRSLLDAGHDVVAFDTTDEARTAAAAMGAKVAGSSKSVARDANVVITSLPFASDVEQALFGSDGVVEGAREETVVVEASTIDLASFRRIAERIGSAGVRLVDAGIFASPPTARQGRGAIVVAGSPEAFERCESVLSHLFRNGRVIFVGESGSAKVVKLLGNMVGAVQVLAISEAFEAGLRAGVDAKAIYEGLGAGMGDCWALHARPPYPGLVAGSPADRDFEPGAPLDYILKDLDYFLSSAHLVGAAPLVAGLARELYGLASSAGLGRKDIAAVSFVFSNGRAGRAGESTRPAGKDR